MKNLMKAEFFRMFRTTSVYVVAILDFVSNVINVAISIMGSAEVGDLMLSACSIGGMGSLAAIMIALFNGADFKNNTIRNKITAGYTRGEIFFTTLIVNQIMYAALFILTALTVLIFGSIMLTVAAGTMFALDLFMLYLLGVAFCALITFISFVTKSGAATVVFALLILSVGYAILAIITFLFLSESSAGTSNFDIPAFISRINIFSMDQIISSSLGAFVELTGSVNDNETVISSIYANAAIVAIIWSALASVGGFLLFRRADIK